jgi:hypothetical protein
MASLALIGRAPPQGVPELAIENNGNKDGGRARGQKEIHKK